MAKNIAPAVGITIKDFVTEASARAEIHPTPALVRAFLMEIKERVNIDTCLTDPQSRYVEGAVRRQFQDYPNDDSHERKRLIEHLSLYINSCRLACGNCINKECGARDYSEEMPTVPSPRSSKG